MKEIKKIGIKIISQIANDLFSESQKNLVNYGAIDTGFLLRSGYIKQISNGFEVGYDAPHSAYINDGTKPHTPPRDVLVKWVKRKLGYSEKKAQQIAFLIQQKIRFYGTEPRPFMSKAIQDIKIKYKLK